MPALPGVQVLVLIWRPQCFWGLRCWCASGSALDRSLLLRWDEEISLAWQLAWHAQSRSACWQLKLGCCMSAMAHACVCNLTRAMRAGKGGADSQEEAPTDLKAVAAAIGAFMQNRSFAGSCTLQEVAPHLQQSGISLTQAALQQVWPTNL